jgi:hypothetical protein
VLIPTPGHRPILLARRSPHPSRTISDWFAQHSIAAGLPPIRLHDVRHSYATAAPRAGVPVKVVSERLGHSSVAFTQQVYMHVIPGMDTGGARLAATAILGTVSGPNSPGDAAVTNSVTTGSDSPLSLPYSYEKAPEPAGQGPSAVVAGVGFEPTTFGL